MDEIDDVLESIRKMNLIFNKSDKVKEFIDPSGIIILIEKDPNDEENFNVSVFNFEEKDGDKFPICKVIASGLMQVLDEDLERVFTTGMKKVLDEADEGVKKVLQAEVVDFNDYKRAKGKVPSLSPREDDGPKNGDDNNDNTG